MGDFKVLRPELGQNLWLNGSLDETANQYTTVLGTFSRVTTDSFYGHALGQFITDGSSSQAYVRQTVSNLSPSVSYTLGLYFKNKEVAGNWLLRII